MSDEACHDPNPRKGPRLREKVGRWLFLYVWCSYFYRPVMRVLHGFNLHYARLTPMAQCDGSGEVLCQWCGLRGTVFSKRRDVDRMIIRRHAVGNDQ